MKIHDLIKFYFLYFLVLVLLRSCSMILEHILLVSAYLFSIDIYDLIRSPNMVRALICLELVLNAVNKNYVTFSDFFFYSLPIKRKYFFNFCYSYCSRWSSYSWLSSFWFIFLFILWCCNPAWKISVGMVSTAGDKR